MVMVEIQIWLVSSCDFVFQCDWLIGSSSLDFSEVSVFVLSERIANQEIPAQ